MSITPIPSRRTVTKRSFRLRFISQWDLQIMVVPGIIFLIVFSYIPIYGVFMAFQEFRIGDFPGFSQWVGLKHFTELIVRDPKFPLLMRNTVVLSILKLLINFPAPILFAVFINELRRPRFKKSIQTISYLPHFISWVVAARLMFDFFSTDSGAINEFLMFLRIIDKPVPFFLRGENYWWMAVVTDVWKEIGWNSIIFLAAIASIDPELYEAADIDGATRVDKVWYITIASIRPTIMLLLIFTIGNLLNANFDQAYMLTNQMGNRILLEYADIFDTYVLRVGIAQTRFSFAAAVGLFRAAISFALLLSANKIADKFGESALF
ncbi:MAG: ABC transporter permease subunit [Clostridia bacterium]|nr:ABC transporter permease subunit [Clostridia bacterium]